MNALAEEFQPQGNIDRILDLYLPTEKKRAQISQPRSSGESITTANKMKS